MVLLHDEAKVTLPGSDEVVATVGRRGTSVVVVIDVSSEEEAMASVKALAEQLSNGRLNLKLFAQGTTPQD